MRFDGRASRSEYWRFVLVFLIAVLMAGIADNLFFPADPARNLPDRHPVTVFVIITMLWSLCAFGVRRLHDVNRSGWWMLFPVALPLVVTAIGSVPVWFFTNAFEHIGEEGRIGVPVSLVAFAGALAWLAAALCLVVFLARPGDRLPNRFGPPAKGGNSGS